MKYQFFIHYFSLTTWHLVICLILKAKSAAFRTRNLSDFYLEFSLTVSKTISKCRNQEFRTGKSFSQARNICRKCCVPILFWMSKQNKNNNLCTQHVLQVFWDYNEQSVVILWVSWCKIKCFWQRFTCKTVFFSSVLFSREKMTSIVFSKPF